jgi:hypothetical protein
MDVKIVAGQINRENTPVRYWKSENVPLQIGGYAIVENANGYDLIKVVGYVYTTLDKVKLFSNTRYENMKNVVMAFGKEVIEREGKENG